jgi:hypothetical protein
VEKQPEKVILTKAEFDGMHEYSMTDPSQTDYGKVWKRNANVFARDPKTGRGVKPEWWMGEYVPDPNAKLGQDGMPETVRINWRKIEVEDK